MNWQGSCYGSAYTSKENLYTEISVEEALALSETQIKTNVKHAIIKDKLNEIFTYAANKVDLCKQEYFQCAIRHSLRVFKYLTMLYPDFKSSSEETIQVWNRETWHTVLGSNFMTIKYVVGVYRMGYPVELRAPECTIDDVVYHSFRNLNYTDREEVLKLFLELGCTVSNPADLARCMLKRYSFETLEILIDWGQIDSKYLLDYLIPEEHYNGAYSMYQAGYQMKDKFLRIFHKYKVIDDLWSPGEPVRQCKKYSDTSYVYKLITTCISHGTLELLESIHNSGYHIKYLHFKHIRRMSHIEFVVLKFPTNKYQRWIKSLLYKLDLSSWDKTLEKFTYEQRLHEMKNSTEWIHFFKVFSPRIDQYARRRCTQGFNHATVARDQVVKHAENYTNILTKVLTVKHDIPGDLIQYVIIPMLW